MTSGVNASYVNPWKDFVINFLERNIFTYSSFKVSKLCTCFYLVQISKTESLADRKFHKGTVSRNFSFNFLSFSIFAEFCPQLF